MTSSSPPKRSFFRLPDSSVFSEPSVWLLIAVNLIPLAGVFFFQWDLFSLMVLYWMETAMIGFYQLIKILIYQTIFAIFLIPFFTFHFGMFMFVHFLFISTLFGPPWVKALRDSVPAILNRLLFQEGFWIPALALFISHGVSFFMHGLKSGQNTNASIDDMNAQASNNPAPQVSVTIQHPHFQDTAAYHSTEDWQSTIESTPAESIPAQPLAPAAENTLSPAQQKMALVLAKSAMNMGANKDMMTEPYKRVIVMHLTIIFGAMLTFALGTSKAAYTLMIALKIAADLFSHANYHGLGNRSAASENSL